MADGFTPAPSGGQQPLAGFAPNTPTFDLIEVLPPAAAGKLLALRQRSADAHRLTVPHADLQEASMARINAERELTRLTDHPQDHGFGLKADAAQVIAAKRLLDRTTEAFARLQDLQQQRSSAWQAASRVVSAVETWLRDARPQGTVLEDIETPEVKLLKGESLTDAISRLQRRCRELKATAHTIASAPHPSGWAKAKMRQEIEALATRGEPDATNLIEHGGAIRFPTLRAQAEVHGAQRSLAFMEVTDVAGLLAFILKPTLTAALDKLIDEASDDAAALSTAPWPIFGFAELDLVRRRIDLEEKIALLAGGEPRRRGPSITPAATRLSTATETAQVVTIDFTEDLARNDGTTEPASLCVSMCDIFALAKASTSQTHILPIDRSTTT
jgi:hypothetical protein